MTPPNNNHYQAILLLQGDGLRKLALSYLPPTTLSRSLTLRPLTFVIIEKVLRKITHEESEEICQNEDEKERETLHRSTGQVTSVRTQSKTTPWPHPS